MKCKNLSCIWFCNTCGCIDFHLAVFTAAQARKHSADVSLVWPWTAMSHQHLSQGHHYSSPRQGGNVTVRTIKQKYGCERVCCCYFYFFFRDANATAPRLRALTYPENNDCNVWRQTQEEKRALKHTGLTRIGSVILQHFVLTLGHLG